ncbi:MAG: LamG domain-containing protein [Kiritimatiellae bacterium]|nr:LamG domain-containing protein [Kiritimatiellia bacterium]
MKKRLAAFAFAALAAFGAQAVGNEGDIWSLEVVPNYSAGYEYPNSITPHKVGESFYILVRLLDYEWKDPDVHEWQILQSADGVAIGSTTATVYWPGLRIAIGNEMVTADYVSTGPNGEMSGQNGELPYYTDLYFKYTVKEGQLGLPVRLVDTRNKIISTSIAGSYSLQFVNVNTYNGLTHRYWNLIKDPGEETEALASFWFCPSSTSEDPDYPDEPAGGPKRDVTKIAPGAYVQTIDFEPTYADATDPLNRIWRDVYQGISDSPGKDPAIIGTAADEGETTTVYIWSEDESVFSVDGITGEEVEYEVKGEIVTRTVYPVQLTANGVSAFKLKGGATAAPGAWTNLVLCATKKPAINASGDIVDGCLVTRRVRVVAAPAPFITLSDADGSRSVSLEATSAYTVGSRMKMTFSKAFDSYDVRVKLMMSVGSTTIDPVAEKYVFISDSDGADPASSVSLDTVTMPKGERETYFYIYPLGTCKELKTTGISITNLVDQTQTEAYDQFKDGTHRGMTVKVTDQKPVVTASIPSSGFKNDTVNVDVTVSDNWRDLSEKNTNGYRVVIFLGGTKVYETNGVAFAENEQVSFPVVIPAEGNPLTGTVQVWDQMGNASDTTLDGSKISIEAKAPLTVMAATFQSRDKSVAPDTDATYAEGQQVYVGAVLSSPSATKMYAFIVPMDAASSNLVYTSATTNGLEINTSGDFAEYSVRAPIKLLDGNIEGRRVNLGVVLKDKPDWSDATAKVIDTYSLGGTWTLTVTNVAPTFASEGVWGGDETNRTEVANGARYPGRVSATTPVQFSVKLADVGIVDATSGTARVRWTWTDGDAENRYTQNQITTVDSNGVTSATFIFDDEGQVQTITLQLQDRDMFADSPSVFGGDKYVFTVAVGDVPTVIIDYDKGMGPHYEETANSKYNYFTVKVSEWPKNVVEGREMLGSSNPLKVRVTLPTDFQDDPRAVLHLQDTAGNVQVDDDEGVILTFRTEKAATKEGIKVYFHLDSQNGGSGPVMDPSEFIVKAEVITTTKASEDMTWAEYFASIEEQVTLMNIEPSIGLDIVSSQDWAGYSGATNEWTAGEEVELRWTYKDIAPDVTNRDASVSWTVADVNNKRSVKVKDAATSITFSAKSPKIGTATGTYKFKVPAAKYTKVTVTARDGDGGESEYEFYIHVIPTKDVIITPVGPSETASSKYGGAAGLGRGHIYVQRSTGQYSMLQFQQTWLYSEHDSAAYLYAAGYPATNTVAYDDGKLGVAAGFNIAAEPNAIGGKYDAATGVPRYDYQGEFDNYFYCWLQKNQEAGTWEVKLVNPTRDPATAQGFNPTLPTDAEDANNPSYPPVEVEAVFAREFYVSDNLGDINADEIPDAYVKLYSGFGVFGDDGSFAGNDFPKLHNFNLDADYLPASERVEYARFIPGPSSDWITTGVPFNARREIRGWDYHLNNGPALSGVRNAASERRYTDPRSDGESTLSELEYFGFVTWCAKNGQVATNEASWLLWTPENPTDPTLADTDDDGVPDGYEYYVWYRAHVGYLDYNGKYRRLTGRRYNVVSPAEPIEIPPEDIERRYNPTQANDLLAYSDTDDDGLNDLYEFELGTSPVDYDTDGDGLPDGFEVYVSETDPLVADAMSSNPDGDAKAELVMEHVPVIGILVDGSVERYAIIHTDLDGGFSVSNETVAGDWVYLSNGVDGYVTASNNVRRMTILGDSYLTSLLPAESTWRCTKGKDSYLRGAPATVSPGFRIDDIATGVKLTRATLLTTPPRAYAVWKYDASWKLVLGQELHEGWTPAALPAGAEVVEPPSEKTVSLLHHHVYEHHGLARDNRDRTRKIWVDARAFDPRTAWRVAGGVETSAFTTYDEFMYPHFMLRDSYIYFADDKLWRGGWTVSTAEMTPSRDHGTRQSIWERYCPDPNNADTDADGSPDGWEAYLFMGVPEYRANDPYKDERNYPYVLLPSIYNGGQPVSPGSPVVAAATGDTSWSDEYAGTDSTGAYPECETIVNGNRFPEWTNKMWPTDPWQGDTDGDGIPDMAERDYFLYGEATEPGAGGGLNPLSWDTDGDGLPDPWEAEFAGVYTAGEETTTSTSTTVDENGNTNTTVSVSRAAGTWSGGMDGSVSDATLDYDRDGLQNWQEYLVGAMRCWRYDDTISEWGNNEFSAADLGIILFADTYTFNHYWTERLVSDGQQGANPDGQYSGYNPRIQVDGYYDCSASYFSLCENAWDPVAGRWYMFRDGINHDLSNPGEEWELQIGPAIVQCNRFTWRPVYESQMYPEPLSAFSRGDDPLTTGYEFGALDEGYVIAPSIYICCDPTKPDTDFDGMDDYYELYHGMNPLLGVAAADKVRDNGYDLVYVAYGADHKKRYGLPSPVASAEINYWKTHDGPCWRFYPLDPWLNRPGAGLSDYDFEIYPWLNGLAYADPDGDDIRNQSEAIMTDMQAQSSWLHTDPTPLWMTDIAYEGSITHRYYLPTVTSEESIGPLPPVPDGFTDVYTGKEYKFNDFPGLSWEDGVLTIGGVDLNLGNVIDVNWAFEENEGYDTDHDYLSDHDEAAGKTKSASDPQDADSPLRRQAMWFPGEDALLETTLEDSEIPPAGIIGGADLPFLYYTVECWAKAEDPSRDQTLVERAIWTGQSNLGDELYLRKNFLIGIKNGRWYTMYDSAGTAIANPQEILDGPAATTNWTHVAATYDGAYLSLYVNGVKYKQIKTGIRPEIGTAAVAISPGGRLNGKTDWGNYIAILVGASATTFEGVILDSAWRGLSMVGTHFSDYNRYFKGYVDEVRVWDGARSENEIRADYRKRYTRADALANRQAVWEVWSQGIYNRAPSTEGMLPAELKRHWTFDHMPGGVSPDVVMKRPAGFTTAEGVVDAKAIWSRPVGWSSLWLSYIPISSTVYSDPAWIPWVSDTVGHLPRFDKTTVDSKYWSEDMVGGKLAAEQGYSQVSFPRTAEPWSRWRQVLLNTEPVYSIDERWKWVSDDPALAMTYSFTMRHHLKEGFDLLPLGGAYARRISSAEGGMWDDGSAADAWAETGSDDDFDRLPDWWADYARNNYCDPLDPPEKIGWDTAVDYDGIVMAAWAAYMRDLARGMLSDGKYHPEFADSRDLDHDGIPDWWEDMYKIDTGSKDDATADPDHDGLSNYQEYRIAEVDRIIALDPTLAHSVTEDVTDYFVQTTNSVGETVYLGELYADHDFMEDLDEDANGLDRTRYDANTDADEDGWSAWSEMRYSDYKMTTAQKFVSHLAGLEEVEDWPVPVVHAKLRYNGTKVPVGSDAPVIVQAYSGNNLQNEPSAVYSVTPGTSETRYLYLGFFEDRVFHGTLTPGWVVNNLNAFSLQVAHAQPDDLYSWTIESEDGEAVPYSGTYEEMRAAVSTYGRSCKVATHAFTWEDTLGSGNGGTGDGEFALKISSVDSTMKGHILLFNKRVGDIDLITGDFDLDVSVLKSYFMSYGIALPQHFLRIMYQTQLPKLQTRNLEISLARPDSGRLTEGTAAFVAFIDADGNGAFTPGSDPIGFMKDVEVGWDQVPSLVIEMTDSSQAAGERFDYGGGSNSVDTLRIVRTSVNGSEEGVKRRIVYSREAGDVKRTTVYEGDLVTSGKFGLDWSSLRADLRAMEGVALDDVTEVGYTVTLGGGSVQNISTADVVRTFTVEYTTKPVKPILYSPTVLADPKVETARPEFKWSATDGYTAFRLQIWNAETNVYTSPLTALPPKDSAGRYFWTPPVYIGTDAADDAWVLANNTNYRWRVAMYNAKFSDTNDAVSAWSDFGAFETRLAAANDFSTRLGRADVRVRYFGPATNELKSVIVQLFRNADFAGVPAAQTRLYGADLAAAANSLTNAAEVSFLGLDEDEYFAVAFIDRNGNAKREPYETWGYSAQVDRGLAAIWRPSGAKVDPTSSEIPEIEVFMEDTDVNRDDVLDWNQPESLLATAAAGTASGADTSDVDLDGLTGDEETGDTYTNKQKWDTDGDGMPDGWEARYADTDPLMADAELVAAGDYMAFVVTNGIYRLVVNAAGEHYLVRDTNSVYRVGDVIAATNLITTYDYTTVVADETLTNFVTVTYAGLGTNVMAAGTFQIDSIAPAAVALVHAQVYDEFGYWQSTAVDPADPLTKPFTALDKYMLARYFEAIGFTGVREEAMNVTKTWKDFTLRPLDPDCDRDGVADGWELYLMFGTNGVASAHGLAVPSATEINPWKYADRDADIDGDTLSLVDEYAQGRTPSDPWNMYSVYEELLAVGVVPDDAEKFTDAKARRFAIAAADYDDDWDLDQISNVQEMWAYYRDMDRLADINPENPRSDGFTPDYFRQIGSTYLGAYYNGGEFVERAARGILDITDLSMAGTRDLYHSGWDLWSIVRYSYAKQERESEEGVSEELSVANKYTYVMYEGYEGVTEEALVEFHQALGHDSCTSLAGVIETHGGLERMKQEIREKAVSSLDAEDFETPEPMVRFTLKYTGYGTRDVIVDVWQTSSIYPERGEQVTASYALPSAFDAGVAYARAKTPARGTLKQGPAKFVAYIDADGSGTLSPGETFGTAEATIGYSDLDLVIRLGDGNPALPTISLVDSGTNDTERPIQTVAIVRTKVNGQYVSPRGVMLKRYDNNVNRTAIYPSDWINETDGFIGVDKYLAFASDEDAGDPTDEALEAVEEVTYEIVKLRRSFLIEGDDGYKISNTNLNHYIYTEVVEDEYGDTSNIYHTVDQQVNEEFTLRYSVARDVPLEVKGEAASKVSDALVSFLVPADRAVTKFWLDVDGVIYAGDTGNGFLLANLVTGDVLNTAPGLTGEYTSRRVILDGDWFRENGIAFTADEHTVRVALGNDKFPEAPSDTAEWSKPAEFSVAADAAFAGKLAVRAVHPVVTNEGAFTTITVAAYERPDLANPVAITTGLANGEAVELGGLRTGRKYYLAAWYVKNAADGRSGSSAADPTVRMPYDTWGYLTMLGTVTNGFNAASVAATEKSVPTNTIWMQDTDWNDNGVADRLENLKSVSGLTPSEAPEWEDVDCDGIPDQDDEDPVFDNSKKSIEGDVMAKATLRMLTVQIGTVDLETNWVTYVVYDPEGEPTADRLDGDTIVIPRGTKASELKSLYTTYLYGRKKSAPLGIGVATNLAEGIVYAHEWKDVVLVHHQVYERFGFNPYTANALAASSNWVNTAKFTALDKYIVTNYLGAIGAVVSPESWTNWTLNARRVDFDYDGVTDGWELYTMFGTNGVQALDKTAKDDVINAWAAADRDNDPDGDEVSNLHEYDGGFEPTDPWDPKSVWRNLSENGYLLPGTPEFTDKEARRFGIAQTDVDNDDDNDLLTNLQEIQAYYYDKTALDGLDPKKAWSDGSTPDYFRAAGSTYLGLLFNGGEFIEPDVRKAMGITTLARTGTRDYDGKGWDAWSTARYSILNREQTLNVDGVVSDELMLLIRYWNVIRPGEFTGTTVGEAVEFFHTVWEGVRRLIDSEGNILIESKGTGAMSGPGTIHHADAAQTTTQIVAFFGGQAKMEETIAKNKKDITADEIVAPEPTVDLTVKYAGNGSYNLVLEAYQRSLAYPEYGGQLTAQWTLPVKFDAGIATVNDIRTPGLGSLKQGPARFVAYIDQDGSGTLSAGDIYGTTDVEVGHLGAKLTIRMGGENDYSYPLVRVQATNDCSIVALVRSKINDVPLYSQVAGVYYCYLQNNAAREAIYPIEFLTEEHTGLDKDLALDYGGELEQIESVTYEILHLDLAGLNDVNVTNLNHYLWIEEVETDDGVSNVVHFVEQSLNEEVTFRYSNTRDKADVWGVADAVKGNVTVSFTVPNDGYANTRFWLKVNGDVYGGEHGNGFLIPPVADHVVVLDQEWFDNEGKDVVFAAGENTVQVLLGNDKFGGDAAVDEWSEEARFSVNAAPDRRGKLAVEVQHPLAGFAKGVTIAAYETADLVNPVVVSNNVASDAAVVLEGLRPGAKYYVAAWYVREAEDGRPNADTRMPWDSWGYYCNLTRTNELQVASSYGFDPVAIAASDTLVPTNVVWLQDTDFNDNGVADREEDFLDVPAFYDRELEVGYAFDIAGAEERHTSGGGSSTAMHWAMAYAVVPYATVATTNERGAVVWYAVVVDPADPSSSNVTSVGIAVGTPLSKLKLASTYYYGKELALGTNVAFAADSEWKVTESQVQDIVLVHAQVLDRFGFNPATANSAIASGERVYSKDFTKRDKSRYLADYLENALGVTNAAAYTLSTTVDDSDPVYGGMGDGIADGWELYMMFKPDGVRDGVVGTVADLTNELVRLSPWNYSDRDGDLDGEGLSNLLEYDGGHFPTNPYDVDTDGDNVTDLYAWRYALKGDEGDDDLDGDGLSNYAEYLISEVFQFHTLDVRNPKTDGACVDYFRKVGQLYLGELFTDHDQVSDVWEAQYDGEKSDTGDIWANRYVYDPDKDLDEDGWSNYAESRAGTSPEVADSIGIDQMTLAEHPVPVIEATVVYNGYDPIYGSIVFRAWNQKFDPEMMHAPDAIWTVPSSVSEGSDGNGTTTDTGAQVLEAAKYVGLKPAGRVVYSLGPGSVTPGSVKIYFRDPAFRRAVVRDRTEVYVSDAGVSQASWYALVQDKNGELVTSITNQTAVAVGSIDYTTGKVEIDFGSAALSGSVYAQMINATSGNEKLDSDITHSLQYFNCEKLNLDASYVKLEWNRTRVGTNVGGVYYLGDADPATGGSSGGSSGGNPFSAGGNSTSFTSMSRGYVREGLNSFVVYADQNGDGDYTPGEPFGFVRDVDVGWQGAKFSVELSETSPIFARVNVRTEENDRVNLYGVYSDTMYITNFLDLAGAQSADEAGTTSDGRYIHVRIDRYSVNDVPIGPGTGEINLPDRVLVDKYIDCNVRCVFHEGDFLNDGEFDIDWSHFEDMSANENIAKLKEPDITSVAYRIVVDNALVVSPATNNLSLACVFTRRFDAAEHRQVPLLPAEELVCHGARPTFSWSMNGRNTYTAFQLQILSGSTVVYDSGVRHAPCMDPEGRYTWTAPISVGDQMPNGRILSAHGNYTWRVAMYNAKFKPSAYVNAYSAVAPLRTDVNVQQDVDDDGFNAVNVCVKYTGPNAVLADCDNLSSVYGKVRLQAFAFADFSGVPSSQTLVTGKDEIADASYTMANAKLIGLPAGTYYIRAYIDSNGNFVKDDWESWGQVAGPVTVGAGRPAPVVGLYIEDADTNQDWVPDALEFTVNGQLKDAYSPIRITGEFLMSKKLSEAVSADTLQAGVSTYLSGATLSAFQYADVIGTLLGVNSSGETTTINAIRKAVEKKVKAGTVKITSIKFDPTGKKVVLAVDAEVADSVAGDLFSKIFEYSPGDEVVVKVKVFRKDSLVQAEWVPVGDAQTVSVGVHSQEVSVPLPSGTDYTSGFYRVEIEQ